MLEHSDFQLLSVVPLVKLSDQISTREIALELITQYRKKQFKQYRKKQSSKEEPPRRMLTQAMIDHRPEYQEPMGTIAKLFWRHRGGR